MLEKKSKGKGKGKGRQKIDIKRIQHEGYRQVTFSKRRNGLFNKATELSVLCGAEVALMVFSPAGKVYSFAHPSVHSVINRYVDGVEDSAVVQNNLVREYRRQLTQVTEELATEKKKAEMLNGLKTDQVPDFWWEMPVDGHDVAELKELMVAMEEFQKNLMKRTDDLMSMEPSSSSPSPSFSSVNPSSRMLEAAPYHGFQMDFGPNDFAGNMSSSFDNFDSSSWSSFEE